MQVYLFRALTFAGLADTEDPMKKAFQLSCALCALLALTTNYGFGQAPSHSVAPETHPTISEDAVKGAVLCYNEAGRNRFDCSAIIKMRMRSARSSDRTFSEELYYLHGDGRARHPHRAALRSDRATNPQRHDSRPWLGDIARDLHEPLGWDRERSNWANYAPRFASLFEFVQGVLNGEIQDRCDGIPTRWGGARVDEELIARHVAEGRVVVDCGPTQNVFLRDAE